MTPPTARPSPSWTFTLISAGSAFLVWASWAFWVNQSPQTAASVPWIAALTQGTCSFLITFCMISVVGWFFAHLPSSTAPWLPALLTVVITGTCLATAHAIAGTPQILRTIAPALVVAFFFNVFTCHRLTLLQAHCSRGEQP